MPLTNKKFLSISLCVFYNLSWFSFLFFRKKQIKNLEKLNKNLYINKFVLLPSFAPTFVTV